jgi:hypothetical protein
MCMGGVCVCDARSCPDGCCVNGACVARDINTCGTHGGTCVTCDPLTADNCSAMGTCSCGRGPACGAGAQCVMGKCM